MNDPEMKSLFQAEAEESLNQLQNGFHLLEKDPVQVSLIDDLFRQAHTLKGSARMMGLASIEKLSHALEDVLTAVKKEQLLLKEAIFKIFYKTIDSIRLLVNEFVTGSTANVPVDQILLQLQLKNLKMASATQGMEVKIQEKEEDKIALRISSQPIVASTVRLPTKLVSELLSRAGDLSIAKSRQQHILNRIESLQSDWDSNEDIENIGNKIHKIYEESYDYVQKLESIVTPIVELIRKLGLVSISKLFDLFPSMVRELSHVCKKEVELNIQSGDISVDKVVLEGLKDPLMHLLRNAIDHGIEEPSEREKLGKSRKGLISLRAHQRGNHIEIEVEDNGRGLNVDAIREIALQRGIKTVEELAHMSLEEQQMLIFLPGFSTKSKINDISGRGVGMDAVNTSVQKLRGTLTVHSKPGKGCNFILTLPISLLTSKVLLFRLENAIYGLPIEFIEFCEWVASAQILEADGKKLVYIEEQPIQVCFLDDLLPSNRYDSKVPYYYPCIVLKSGADKCGIMVDDIIAEAEIVIEPLSPYLSSVRHISGSSLLRNGEICLVLNPAYIFETIHGKSMPISKHQMPKHNFKILIVDDSFIVRSLVRRALENEGYQVIEAENGAQAWSLLQSESNIKGVISDIEMPQMDGWALLNRIKGDEKFKNLPIILLTSLSTEDSKKRGMDMGADAYIVKTEHSYPVLMQRLKELLA